MTPAPISVERLRATVAFNRDVQSPFPHMETDPEGQYVRHSDYAALLQQLAEREADLEREQGVREDAQRQLRVALNDLHDMRWMYAQELKRAETAERAREEARAPGNQEHCSKCDYFYPKGGVCMCYAGRSDATPPAHGDGEGDAWTYPNRNALIREVCEGLRGYRFDVDPVCVMAIINSIPAQVFSRMAPPVLTTRPTPEAQEARDAVLTISVCEISDGDDPFIFAINGKTTIAVLQEIEADLLENRSEILRHGHGDYVFTATQFEGQYGHEGRCEIAPGWELSLQSFAALALPAQGEGENG